MRVSGRVKATEFTCPAVNVMRSGAMARSLLVGGPPQCPAAVGAEAIGWIAQPAALQRQAAAADAVVELITQGDQLGHACIERLAPCTRQSRPVRARGRARVGQACQGRLNLLQGKADALGDANQRDAAQDITRVASLIARIADAADQAA